MVYSKEKERRKKKEQPKRKSSAKYFLSDFLVLERNSWFYNCGSGSGAGSSESVEGVESGSDISSGSGVITSPTFTVLMTGVAELPAVSVAVYVIV